jgi:two-component system sensor histidine kinase PrrB
VYDDGRAPGLPGPATSGAAAGPAAVPAGLNAVTASSGDRWRVLVRPVRRGALEVAEPLAPVDARIAGLRRDVVIAAILGLLACAVAVRVLCARALAPLQRLRTSAARVSTTRDLTTRLDEDGPPELADVAHSLNAMLARVEASLEAARRFTADAGHELRTPLTSQRANLAVLARDDLAPQERDRVLQDLEAGQERLAALLDALQALARGDAALPVRQEQVDLADLADAALADAKARHPHVAWSFGEAGTGTIQGDPAGLRAAIDNLLENAARHGATRVTIAVRDTAVIVDDDGPGIPPEERERVFERFARGRRTGAPGSGLGLAIVAQQARLHHGHAEARTSPQGGARLILSTWDDPSGQRRGARDDRAVSGDRAGADDVGDPAPG